MIKLSFRQLQLASSKVYPGSNVDVLGEILNSGTVTARLTNVKLILEDPLISTPYSTYYIGDVSPYSTSSFTLSFRVSHDAKPGTYRLKIVAEAENMYGDKIETQGFLNVNIGEKPLESSEQSKSSQQSFSLITQQLFFIIIVLAVIIIVLGYLAIGRRKKIEIT